MRRGFGWELLPLGLAVLCFWFGFGTATDERIGFSPEATADGALRVVSWNVGITMSQGGAPLPRSAEAHVVSVLSTIDPHLVLLQEVRDADQLERLLDRLGREWHGALGPPYEGRRVAALAPSGSLRTLRQSRSDGSSMGFQVDFGRIGVTGVVIHADALSSRRRNLQVGQAIQLLTEFDGPMILAGDLNIDLDLDKRRDLFTDDEYRDVETYNYLSERLTDTTVGTGSTAEPDRRLDYVFVSGWRDVVTAGPWRRQRAAGMDHDPVVVDLYPPQPNR